MNIIWIIISFFYMKGFYNGLKATESHFSIQQCERRRFWGQPDHIHTFNQSEEEKNHKHPHCWPREFDWVHVFNVSDINNCILTHFSSCFMQKCKLYHGHPVPALRLNDLTFCFRKTADVTWCSVSFGKFFLTDCCVSRVVQHYQRL